MKKNIATLVLAGVLGLSLFAYARVNTPQLADTSSFQASDADLTTLASPTALRYVYTDGSNAYIFVASGTVLTDLVASAPSRALLALTSSSSWRTQLDAQTLDPILTNYSALVTAANELSYFSGSDTHATTSFTAAARAILDDTTTSSMQTTLGLGTLATLSSVDMSANTNWTAGRSLTITGDDVAADAELFTRTISITIPAGASSPTSSKAAFQLPTQATIVRVFCYSSPSGTSTIQFDRRTEAAPLTAGTDIFSSAQNCGIGGTTITSFSTTTLTSRAPVNLDFDTVAGTPSSTVILMEVTMDD